MIEEREELQGQLIASGQIIGSIVGCKGEKGDPGEPGSPGSPGTPGQDGFSPIASISKTGKIATITITDSQGTTTAEIRDGEDGSGSGDMLKATYDTNDNGIVDNAEKVNNHTVQSDVPANAVFTDTTYTAGTGIEITANNVINNTQTSAEWGNISGTLADQTDLKNALDSKGTYSKPSGGIPKTDLASAVQTSLGLADSAIQSSDLSTVATTGDYDDLIDKPTIPSKVSDLTNDSGFINKNVNNLTNYTTTSVINTLLAGKENDIPIQDTAPTGPEENDLWIDTSEPEEMQEAIKNEYSTSTSNTYSCDYVNDIQDEINTKINTLAKSVTFNNEWRIGYKPSGGNFMTTIPINNPSKHSVTFSNNFVAEIYDGGWKTCTVNVSHLLETELGIRLTVPSGVTLTDGNVYLIRFSGTVTVND